MRGLYFGGILFGTAQSEKSGPQFCWVQETTYPTLWWRATEQILESRSEGSGAFSAHTLEPSTVEEKKAGSFLSWQIVDNPIVET